MFRSKTVWGEMKTSSIGELIKLYFIHIIDTVIKLFFKS